MLVMARIFQRGRLCALLAAGLAFGLACERSQPDQPADPGVSAAEQKIPFHDGREQTSPVGAQGSPRPNPASSDAPPFRGSSSRIVPPGTLVTVQLQHTLSSTGIHPGDTFTAVIAAPLTVNGDILIDRGAAVTVRVESARSRPYQPGSLPGSGYIRLSLSAIDIDGKQIPLQTSSLFARGLLQKPDGVRIPKGRDLTFRLTSPLALDQSEVVARHQAGSSATD